MVWCQMSFKSLNSSRGRSVVNNIMDEPSIKQLIENEDQNAAQSSQNSMLSRIDYLISNNLGSLKESKTQLSNR